MRKTVALKKGLNLNLAGGVSPDAPVVAAAPVKRVAIVPDDFPGFIPKPQVGEGDLVACGTPLLRDKSNEAIKLVSPLAGRIEAIVRGARRKIERVVVVADSEADTLETIKFDSLAEADATALTDALCRSGLWALMRQRPFDVVPQPGVEPRSIMITAMDTAPLALSLETAVEGRHQEIAAAIKALRKLTKGNIYIGVAAGSTLPDFEGAEMVEFPMLHPAGNAGVQIANIEPVNKGEVVWTLDIVTAARIGHLILKGEIDSSTRVAVTGSEVENPQVVVTTIGVEMKTLIEGNLKTDGCHQRVVSGNLLTGIPVGEDGFLRFPYRQVTVIPEGDDADEFMGWASMSPSKMSVSPSFIGRFLGRKFSPDARINGGRRAMIMSGQYDKVMPMDILPEYLIKAIIAKDIDRMEALGIYEVAPEDFALAEYVDPSKLELQKIVREGLDYMRSEV